MSKHLTIHEASQRLGKGAEQIRRYIKSGKLEATKEGLNTPYLISITSIEQYEHELEQKASSRDAAKLGLLDTRLQEMQNHIDKQTAYLTGWQTGLHLKIEELEHRISRIEGSSQPTQPIAQHRTYEHRIPAVGDKQPLPPGWSSWNNFVTRHGLRIDDRSVQQLSKSEYVVRNGEYVQGRATIKEALNEEGQGKLIVALRNMRKFKLCEIDSCVCHQDET